MPKKLLKIFDVGASKRRLTLDCVCGADDVLNFVYFERCDDGDPASEYEEVYVATTGTAMGLIQRLKIAWKLLLFGHWENVGISLSRNGLLRLSGWISETLSYWDSLEDPSDE